MIYIYTIVLILYSSLGFSLCDKDNTIKVDSKPFPISFSPTDNIAYLVSSSKNTITSYTYDPQTGKLNKQFSYPTNGSNPRGPVFSPDGKYLYVTNQDSYNIQIFKKGTSNTQLVEVQKIQLRYKPQRSTFSPDGKYYYVISPTSYKVMKFDVNNDHTISYDDSIIISTGTTPTTLTFSPNGSYAYIINGDNNTIDTFEYDPKTGDLTKLADKTIFLMKPGFIFLKYSNNMKTIYLPSATANIIKRYDIIDESFIVDNNLKNVEADVINPTLVTGNNGFLYITEPTRNKISVFKETADNLIQLDEKIDTFSNPGISIPSFENPNNYMYITGPDHNCISTHQIQNNGLIKDITI